MLVDFINGQQQYTELGCEQGDIEKWDDLVLATSASVFVHYQAKRQNTPFSIGKCIRGIQERGKNIGEMQDLSAFDEAMKSLGDWIRANKDSPALLQHKFIICVPSLQIQIKEDLELRSLHSLCHSHVTTSTTVDRLTILARGDTAIQNILDWLQKWCDFDDMEQILRALSLLSLHQTGSENDLERETETILDNCFRQSSEVRERLLTFISHNSTYASSVTPRPLLQDVIGYLLPGKATWTKYKLKGTNWHISGTQDMTFESIEQPPKVVTNLWSNTSQAHLLFEAPVESSNSIFSKTVMRLALHFRGIPMAYIYQADVWKEIAKKDTGGTLGISEEDFDDLKLTEYTPADDTCGERLLDSLIKQDEEAIELGIEMLKVTWQLICLKVSEKITNTASGTLRSSIDERWRIWKEQLDNNSTEQYTLCCSMVHPKAEGDDILSEMRIGPRTAKLIAEGLYLLVIVSVSLNDTNMGWKQINAELNVETRALSHWSGVSGKRRNVRKLSDIGIQELLGKESSKVLILSQVELSRSDIESATMADNGTERSSMASPHRPALVVTRSMKMKMLIERGGITEISTFLKGEILSG